MSIAHFGAALAPVERGYRILLLNMRLIAGLGSVATSLWGAVASGSRNGIPDWSMSSMVSIVFSYSITTRVARRVDK